jgi:hypothetical protein
LTRARLVWSSQEIQRRTSRSSVAVPGIRMTRSHRGGWPWLYCQAGREQGRAGSRIARGCSSVVEPLPSKQAAWVRFPSPAFGRKHGGRDDRDGVSRSQSAEIPTNPVMILRERYNLAAVAQLVERVLGKDEVLGSNPSGSFWVCCPTFWRERQRAWRLAPSAGMSVWNGPYRRVGLWDGFPPI